MNSFFVPQLGSQIYTMPRMTTRLNLEADRPGTYHGLSAQFSGDGFSDMRFDVVALTPAAFEAWLAATRAGGARLDATSYGQLAHPGTLAEPAIFGSVAPQLFEAVVMGDATAAGVPRPAPTSGENSPHSGN
jgi:cytochrome o ubiquinol oxidase subunit 2